MRIADRSITLAICGHASVDSFCRIGRDVDAEVGDGFAGPFLVVHRIEPWAKSALTRPLQPSNLAERRAGKAQSQNDLIHKIPCE